MKVCSKLLRGRGEGVEREMERGWRGGGEGVERGWRGGGGGVGEGDILLNKSCLYKSSTCNFLLEFTM